MKNKSIVTVPEWLFVKIYDEASKYHIQLILEYTEDDTADFTKLRVEEVLAETEKAYKVSLDAETLGGHVKTWTAWLPKSLVA